MCTSDADQNLSASLLLHSTISFFVLSRTPKDAYYNALLLPETTAVIHIFYDKQVEFSPLTGARRQGRQGQWDWLIPPRTCIPRTSPSPNHHSEHPPVRSHEPAPTPPQASTSTLVITATRPTSNLGIDGVALIDLSLFAPLPPPRLLLTFRRTRSRRRVVIIIPRPSSFSGKCHAWNIGRDRRRVHTRPPRRLVNIFSFSEAFLGTPPTRIPIDIGSLVHSRARNFIH